MDFEGATAVVTGGASGLGRAFCEELGMRRARVLIGDVDRDGAEETADRVRGLGGEARVERCDVREAAQVSALAEVADEWLGATDLLINNAGVAVGGPIGDISLEDWKWQVDINLWGVIHGCHFWVPRMRSRGHGHVLNVASAAGLLAPPQMGPYNVTKAGVIALSETLHAELKRNGIRVTALCPTFFVTKIADSSRGVTDEQGRAAIRRVMERSKVQAPDVARCALDAVARGELYCLPMRDGRVSWLLKRAIPGSFYSFLSRFGDADAVRRLLRAD